MGEIEGRLLTGRMMRMRREMVTTPLPSVVVEAAVSGVENGGHRMVRARARRRGQGKGRRGIDGRRTRRKGWAMMGSRWSWTHERRCSATRGHDGLRMTTNTTARSPRLSPRLSRGACTRPPPAHQRRALRASLRALFSAALARKSWRRPPPFVPPVWQGRRRVRPREAQDRGHLPRRGKELFPSDVSS